MHSRAVDILEVTGTYCLVKSSKADGASEGLITRGKLRHQKLSPLPAEMTTESPGSPQFISSPNGKSLPFGDLLCL